MFILQHEGQSLRHYANQVLESGGVQPIRTLLIRNIKASAKMASMGLGVAFCLESYLQYMHFINPPQIFPWRSGSSMRSSQWPTIRNGSCRIIRFSLFNF